VTPEGKEHLDKARHCLTRARTVLAAGVGEDAGRNAYLVAFHAAQALIAERTGKNAKTHKGVHAQFARLTRNEPRLGLELRQFLAQAYDIKSIVDYGLGPDADVPLDRAGSAIDTAEQFVERVTELLRWPPGEFRERLTYICAPSENEYTATVTPTETGDTDFSFRLAGPSPSFQAPGFHLQRPIDSLGNVEYDIAFASSPLSLSIGVAFPRSPTLSVFGRAPS
jgi:uncharacterized protein (UPF0332 family)